MSNKYLVKDFIHKVGHHCESSAMRDLFEYHGFPMSEAMAFGLDATMGFGYFDKSNRFTDVTEGDIPFFFGGKQGTIEPNSLACRLLGITLRKQSFTSADKAWQESKALIDQDIPLILRADIAYLPYFEEGEEAHFGGHAITLAGYDEEKGIAFIGDTEFEGFLEVPIEDLKKARNSMEGPSFMRAGNTQFSMSRRPDGKHPPLAAGAKLAIQQACNHMLRPSISNNGLQGLKMFMNAIPKWAEDLKGTIENPYSKKKISLARLMFELAHGYIETWGTGGASFRNLYKEFFEELLTHPKLKDGPRAWSAEDFSIVEGCLPIISESARNWTFVAETLKQAADEFKGECLEHVNLEEVHDAALIIYNKEKELFEKLSKIKI